MIAFQNIKTGLFFAGFAYNPPSERADRLAEPQWTKLLSDAYPYNQSADEDRMRRDWEFLGHCRTVTFSTRIDHPDNSMSRLSPEELAQRYPITRQ